MTQTIETEAGNILAQQGYWPAVASEYFAEGNYSKAADLCMRMLENEPQVVSGRVILARSLYHAGQFRQAREQFVQVLKFDSDNLVALKYLGDVLFRAGEEAAAMAYYRRVFEIDPHTSGLKCAIEKAETVETRQLTIRRPSETVPVRKSRPLLEPAFITETAGDIYREQGYFQLAREVYARLLQGRENNRIADKLRETEDKLNKKEGAHESSN
jgi:tetratricopeptide (TPR) repeat protein